MKILAVDDDPDFLDVFETVLNGLGHGDVTRMGSGREVLDLLATSEANFDLFVLDIQMPEMDGIQLCRAIRAIDRFRDTPIIMNTAMGDRENVDAAFAAGATDYLTKPVDPVEIKARLGVISRLLNERELAKKSISQGQSDRRTGPSYGFEDGIPLKRVEGAIDLFAMGNYLKTLGMFRALSVCAVAVSVSNARQIHDLEGGYVFGEVMIDVATCLSDCLNPSNRMLAYAGSGIFVCLVSRTDLPEPERLGDQLRQYVMEFEEIYRDLDIQLPVISVGPAIQNRAMQLGSPSRIIDEAIASAKSSRARYASTA